MFLFRHLEKSRNEKYFRHRCQNDPASHHTVKLNDVNVDGSSPGIYLYLHAEAYRLKSESPGTTCNCLQGQCHRIRHAGYLHTSSGSTESQLYRSTQVLTVASSQYVTLCRCRLSSILRFNHLCTTFRIMRSTNCAIRQDCNIVGTFQSRDNSFCLVLILFRDTTRKQALQLTETAPISNPRVH